MRSNHSRLMGLAHSSGDKLILNRTISRIAMEKNVEPTSFVYTDNVNAFAPTQRGQLLVGRITVVQLGAHAYESTH
jgi:hypothetical protein